jgi:hypothetical protein
MAETVPDVTTVSTLPVAVPEPTLLNVTVSLHPIAVRLAVWPAHTVTLFTIRLVAGTPVTVTDALALQFG